MFATCFRVHATLALDSVHVPGRLIAPREYLALFDIDEKALSLFAGGQPLDDAQRERMLTILFRLQRYSPAAVDHFSRAAADVATIAERPNEARGEIFTLAGRVTQVEKQELSEADRQRFEFDAYYRCTLETDAGEQGAVCALAVPQVWKLDQPIDERGGARAMFLKVLPPAHDGDLKPDAAKKPSLLFVARRVAWYPDTLLGKLGMDVGLLDTVRDKTGLAERECFYQLLAAVHRADQKALRKAARDERVEMEPQWRKEADNKELGREQRAAARRALERAKQGASDVVPLFNDSASMRGKLVTLRGDALRAIEVRVDDPDVVDRFGLRHYYEVEIVTRDSQNNPIVCCVAQLPEGMPLGDHIRAEVAVTGFFLKSWAYGVEGGATKQERYQLAPLVIAGTLTWIPEPAPGGPNLTLAAVLVVVLLAAVVVTWYVRRGDRRALAAAEGARLQLPEQISLEELRDEDA